MSTASIAAAAQWRSTLLARDASVQDAIRNLNDSSLQIALVVSSSGVLLGTVTDGDVRRGLLKGLPLEATVDLIMNANALVVPQAMSRENVLHVMRANRIHQVPVVDADRHVIGLHLWDELVSPAERPNTMVVMAGGLGTRLRPHTENCPKPLLPVAGRPILEHIIERAKQEGFSRFCLAVHYLGHMIEEYFGDGSKWGVTVSYLREQQPLGTAGALGLMEVNSHLPFVVTNGDVLTDIRYGELLDFHARHGADATMAVRLYEWQHPFGVVHTTGVDIASFEEKPVMRTHVNAGIYALEPGVLKLLSPGERCDMPTLFQKVQEQGRRTVAYPMHEPWLDVGRPDDLSKAEQRLSSPAEMKS